MALGASTFQLRSGGGATGPGPASLSRQAILAMVSPGGTVNTLYKPASLSSAMVTTGGVGPLAEAAALAFNAAGSSGGPAPMLLPMNPSTFGDCSAVAASGGATGTVTVTEAPHKQILVYCTLGGTIATMKIKTSLDAGVTWSDEVTSSDTGGGAFLYRVPGTFVKLNFAAAIYVVTKTVTVDVFGAVTNGSGWVGIVTVDSASPLDTHEARITCIRGGALGVATVEISLDNGTATGGGATSLGVFAFPAGGNISVPNTGYFITGSGTFTAGDVYTFLATPPGYSTSDITSAITALRTDATAPTAGVVVLGDNPSTQTTAFSAASTLDTALDTALSTSNRDYEGMVNIPCSEGALTGDVVYSSGSIRSAVTSTQINTAATANSAFDKVSIFVGANRVVSPITGYKCQRTSAITAACRMIETTPKQGTANRGGQPLNVAVLGRNELIASVTVHDNKINCFQTVDGLAGTWLAIESGSLGWRNFTADANYVDADAMRMVNAALAALRPEAARLIGQRPKTNSDGTPTEEQSRTWDRLLDGAFRRACGFGPGASFSEEQASSVEARVDRASQLGQSPYRLIVEYVFQRLGFVGDVLGRFTVTGVL